MISEVDDSLYETICGWWEKRNFAVLPREVLTKRGYVAFVASVPTMAAWLYKDETSSIGMMEWMVARHDATHEEKNEAFSELCNHIQGVAKDLGIIMIMSAVNNESLKNRFLNEGFLKQDEGMTHLVKIIGG